MRKVKYRRVTAINEKLDKTGIFHCFLSKDNDIIAVIETPEGKIECITTECIQFEDPLYV